VFTVTLPVISHVCWECPRWRRWIYIRSLRPRRAARNRETVRRRTAAAGTRRRRRMDRRRAAEGKTEGVGKGREETGIRRPGVAGRDRGSPEKLCKARRNARLPTISQPEATVAWQQRIYLRETTFRQNARRLLCFAVSSPPLHPSAILGSFFLSKHKITLWKSARLFILLLLLLLLLLRDFAGGGFYVMEVFLSEIKTIHEAT